MQGGLHCSSMTRRAVARDELYYDCASDSHDESSTNEARRLSHWHFSMRCVLHVFSSGLAWGLSEISSKEVIDSSHMVTRCCIDSSFALMKLVYSFVASRVVIQDSEQPPHIRREWFVALGVKDDVLETALRVDPRWDTSLERLLVSPSLQDDLSWRDIVCSVVVPTLRWKPYSETRWVGVRSSSALFFSSVSIGLKDLVQLAYNTPFANTYYLGGFATNATPETLIYLAIACIASILLEALV